MTVTTANEPQYSETTSNPAEQKTLLRVLSIKDCLADVLGMQGKSDEAVAMLRDVLRTRETILGQTSDDQDLCRTMNNLAGALPHEFHAEAGTLFQKVFEADKRKLGMENIHTIISMNNLAQKWSDDQGKQMEAEDMMRHAVQLSEKIRGADHPETVYLMDNLRELLKRQGNTEEAEQMLRERPTIQERVEESAKVHDDEETALRQALAHSQTDTEKITALRNLSNLLDTKGRYSETEDLLRQSVELSADANGPEDESVQADKQNLGVVMRRQGRYEEAEEIFRALLSQQEHHR